MNKFVIGLAFVGAFIFTQNSEAREKLYIVTEHYPPYEMETPVDGLSGFDYEVVTKVFDMIGFEADINFLPWKRALQEARIGKTVGVLTCAHRPERAEFLFFSDPISQFTNSFFTRSDFDGVIPLSIDDVKKEKVGSVTGYESLAALKDAGIDAVEASNSENALTMLQMERFDYLYVSAEQMNFEISQRKMSEKFTSYPIIRKDFHFCFSKKYPNVDEIMEKFNNALDLMKYSGVYDQIHAKYK